MNRRLIVIFLSVLLANACGLSGKKSSKKKGNKEKSKPYSVEYLDFDETMSRFKALDENAERSKTDKGIERAWLWQNVFAALPELTSSQRDKLDSYIAERRGSAGSRDNQFLADEIQTPESEDFSIELPPHHSVRIPVTSFCLDAAKSGPSSTIRYEAEPIEDASLVRQILFKYLEGQESDQEYQSLMWSLENSEGTLEYIPEYTRILDELEFEYSPEQTLSEFEALDSTKRRARELGIGDSETSDAVRASLVSTRGYSGGDLILFNSGDETETITPEDLKVRLIPSYDTSEPLDAGEGAVSETPEEKYQSIYVSGVDPQRIEQRERDNQNRAENLNDINRQIDELIESGEIEEPAADALNYTRDYASELMAQGEMEAGDNLYNDANSFREALASGADLATALTPGVNDIRDAYEFATGKDMITGEELQLWERALSGMGLIGGSGVLFRKGIDALTRSAGASDEVYDVTTGFAENMGRRGSDSQTVLGHYPEYMEMANDLSARRFEIPVEQWNRMSPTEQWNANKTFLDRTIQRGDDILLATPERKTRPGTFFARELEYLESRGYTRSADGRRMVPSSD